MLDAHGQISLIASHASNEASMMKGATASPAERFLSERR